MAPILHCCAQGLWRLPYKGRLPRCPAAGHRLNLLAALVSWAAGTWATWMLWCWTAARATRPSRCRWCRCAAAVSTDTSSCHWLLASVECAGGAAQRCWAVSGVARPWAWAWRMQGRTAAHSGLLCLALSSCFTAQRSPSLYNSPSPQHIKREHPGLDVICGNVVATWQVGGCCLWVES